MSEWQEMPFSEAFTINPPVKLQRGQPYPYIDMASVNPASRSVTSHVQRPFSGSGSKFMDGDTLLARITPCLENGKIARYLADNTQEAAYGSTEFIVIRGRQGITDDNFAFYMACSKTVQNFAVGEMTGTSGRQRVPVGAFANLIINIPPLTEQRAIASTLSILDDKIEANQRMNETLEAMAQAIFRDWFVNFGPTRAKMEDRAPYLTPNLWKLFPDKLDDEGKPEGWHKGTLSNIAKIEGKNVDPSKVPEGTPYIGLEHMPRKSVSLEAWDKADKVTSNKSVFKKGDTLFGKLRPYFHKVGVAPVDGICSTDIIVVTPKEDNWTAYVLACLSSEEFVDYTDKTSTGTKMPRTSWKIMEKYSINIPYPKIINAFQKITRPLVEVICSNVHESRTLARTRDTLLPEVMSGKIQLSEPPKHMEAIS